MPQDSGVSDPASREFSGCTAVVTGASSGIGQAIAVELARRGARLALACRRPQCAEAALTGIPGAGYDLFQADLANEESVEAWIDRLASSVEKVDILIHAAGAFAAGPVDSLPVSELDHQYRLNIRLPYRLTQALLPALRKARGQVVFINSSAVFHPSERVIQYAATKAALRTMADAIRAGVNHDGIRVMSIYPGKTATPMQAEALRGEGRVWNPECMLQPGEIASAVLHSLLLPRSAEITDIQIRPMRPYEV